jgi:acetyl-CoA C-acetyltransferase
MIGRQLCDAVGCQSLQELDIRYKDIYSCFPVAVTVACRELGLECSDGATLTCTGGLPFHGGPGSNYRWVNGS